MGFLDFLFGGKKGPAKADKAGAKEPDPKDAIAEVEGYYRKPGVAVLKLRKGELSKGDSIWIKGHTSDIKCRVDSIQLNHKDVEHAEKGQSIGLKVPKRVRRGDQVFRA